MAIKRLHEQFAADEEFRTMFLDEARVASSIHHPNVIPVLDVVEQGSGLYLVMDYAEGESLATLGREVRQRDQFIPVSVAVRLAIDALRGLHAAHEAEGENGEPLGIVHRDVSPQNILVGTDGITRVLDFGIAKAAERATCTRDGHIKGKLSYLSPEQVLGGDVDRRADIFSLGIVLWEMLSGRRLIEGKNDGERMKKILFFSPSPLRPERPEVPAAIENIVMQALRRDPRSRYTTAEQMAIALEETGIAGSPSDVARWLRSIADAQLRQRSEMRSRSGSETSEVRPRSNPSFHDIPVPSQDRTMMVNEAELMPMSAPPAGEATQTQEVSIQHPSKRRAVQLAVLGVLGALLGALLGVFWLIG